MFLSFTRTYKSLLLLIIYLIVIASHKSFGQVIDIQLLKDKVKSINLSNREKIFFLLDQTNNQSELKNIVSGTMYEGILEEFALMVKNGEIKEDGKLLILYATKIHYNRNNLTLLEGNYHASLITDSISRYKINEADYILLLNVMTRDYRTPYVNFGKLLLNDKRTHIREIAQKIVHPNSTTINFVSPFDLRAREGIPSIYTHSLTDPGPNVITWNPNWFKWRWENYLFSTLILMCIMYLIHRFWLKLKLSKAG